MSLVSCDVSERVATICLNDPDRRNTISLAMNDELVACVDDLEQRADVGAIVLTGAAPAFCAGADLEDLRTCSGAENLGRIYAGFLRIAHTTIPTIAAVNGAAVGAGMNMALACDVILAGVGARFDPRFLQIGIHPGGGHTWRLRRITDQQAVMAMVLFGERIDGERAAEIGLAWRCLPDGELLAGAYEMAGRAAAAPPDLVRRTKATITSLAGVTTSQDAVAHELDPQVWSMGQPAFTDLLGQLQSKMQKR